MQAIVTMVIVISIIISVTLRSCPCCPKSNMQNLTHWYPSVLIHSLPFSTHFISQIILFWFGDQRVRGRNYRFLGCFCSNLCVGLELLSQRILLQFLCALPKLWCALLSTPVAFLGQTALRLLCYFAYPGRELEKVWSLSPGAALSQPWYGRMNVLSQVGTTLKTHLHSRAPGDSLSGLSLCMATLPSPTF